MFNLFSFSDLSLLSKKTTNEPAESSSDDHGRSSALACLKLKQQRRLLSRSAHPKIRILAANNLFYGWSKERIKNLK